jgi:hypothetical protein
MTTSKLAIVLPEAPGTTQRPSSQDTACSLKIKTLAFCHKKDVSAARHHAGKRAIQNGNLLPQIAKGVPYSPPNLGCWHYRVLAPSPGASDCNRTGGDLHRGYATLCHFADVGLEYSGVDLEQRLYCPQIAHIFSPGFSREFAHLTP